MNKIYILVFFAFAILLSCNGTSNQNEFTTIEKIKSMQFSDTLKLDTFKVKLTGTSMANSELILSINSFEGKEIFKTSIKGLDLIQGNKGLKKEADQIKFLQNEVNYFFEEEHFMVPAVLPKEKANKHVPDVAFYEELKQTTLNGFNYSIGKETKIYIAWSPKEQKVKVYFKCC